MAKHPNVQVMQGTCLIAGRWSCTSYYFLLAKVANSTAPISAYLHSTIRRKTYSRNRENYALFLLNYHGLHQLPTCSTIVTSRKLSCRAMLLAPWVDPREGILKIAF